MQHTSLQCSLLMTGSTLYLDNFRDSSDAHQPNEEICCSDYQFVFMGVKGVIIGFINSSSRAMHIRLFCTSLYREMKNPPVTSFFQLFWQDLGLLFMLMFLGPIASKQMSVERIDGFFQILPSVILYLTGMNALPNRNKWHLFQIRIWARIKKSIWIHQYLVFFQITYQL